MSREMTCAQMVCAHSDLAVRHGYIPSMPVPHLVLVRLVRPVGGLEWQEAIPQRTGDDGARSACPGDQAKSRGRLLWLLIVAQPSLRKGVAHKVCAAP